MTKLKIPCIGMGTFGSDHASAQEVSSAIRGAISCGYRLCDCASVYQNEAEIGKIFAQALVDGIVQREDLFIMSKVWNDMHGKGDVLLSLAQTLKDLQLDYLDAYFVHWPFPNYHPPGCDVDARSPDARPFLPAEYIKVWRQMERLLDMGLVRHLGMSNMTIQKLEAILPLCKHPPELMEMELHPSFQQPELFEYCRSKGIQPVGYCPIGSPNRPERDKTSTDVADTALPEVVKVADAHGVHPAIVCLKWAVQRGQIPIPFSIHEKNYKANLESVSTDPLTQEEMDLLSHSDQNCRLVKGQVFLWEGATSWEALWDEPSEQ
jgi:alcohol dehydrogenase (NADP+)